MVVEVDGFATTISTFLGIDRDRIDTHVMVRNNLTLLHLAHQHSSGPW